MIRRQPKRAPDPRFRRSGAHVLLWQIQDSNLGRNTPTDLQTGPHGALTCKFSYKTGNLGAYMAQSTATYWRSSSMAGRSARGCVGRPPRLYIQPVFRPPGPAARRRAHAPKRHTPRSVPFLRATALRAQLQGDLFMQASSSVLIRLSVPSAENRLGVRRRVCRVPAVKCCEEAVCAIRRCLIERSQTASLARRAGQSTSPLPR